MAGNLESDEKLTCTEKHTKGWEEFTIGILGKGISVIYGREKEKIPAR